MSGAIVLENEINDDYTVKYSESNFSMSASHKQSPEPDIKQKKESFDSETSIEVTTIKEESKTPVSPNKVYQSQFHMHLSSTPARRARSKSLSTVASEKSTTFFLLDMSDDEESASDDGLIHYDDYEALHEGDEDRNDSSE